MNNGETPAVPVNMTDYAGHGGYEVHSFGLTKREHFAAMAMQGLCTKGTDNTMPDYYAHMAVKHADALLKALENDK